MKNLFAYTALGGAYPAYVSINRTEHGVAITVRGHAQQDGAFPRSGDVVCVTISEDDYRRLVLEGTHQLDRK